MIRIRDDDVLIHSSGHKDPFARLKQVHELIVKEGALHVPAILVTEIQDFPEAIRYIRDEREAGRMEVQWHGLEHVDYAKKDRDQIIHELLVSQQFFIDNFGVRFTKFYTPWGANAPHIYEAAATHNIETIDCSNWIRCVHVNKNPKQFRGKDIEITIHWYEGIDRLKHAFRNLRE